MIATDLVPRVDELVMLYDSVGWTAYTNDPATLHAAVAGSSFVVTGWDRNNRLVGLARVMSDDASIAYIQDVLVHPDRQRGGVGRILVQTVLTRYSHVRQVVLVTDDEPRQTAFYTALGFTLAGTGALSALRTFARFASPAS